MKSIQRRLGIGLVSVMLVVGLILAQTSLWLFELGLRRYLEDGLREEAESLLIAIIRSPQGLQLDHQRLSPAYQRIFSGHYFRINFPASEWRSRSLWDTELAMPDTTGPVRELAAGPRGQSLLVYRADYKRFGEPLSISVAQDYTPVRESFQRVERIGLALGAMALLIILVLQRLTVRNALRPLEIMRQQIAQLQQGRRVQLDTLVPEELQPLVAQVNRLLTHTEDSLKRARHSVGDLGHGLKTPLAVLMSLAASKSLDQQPALRLALQQQLVDIERRLSRELNRARLSGDALPGLRFDCDVELPALFATLTMVHGLHVAMSCTAEPGLLLPWEREDLLELLGNLLDNACKWATSQVCLTIEVVEPADRQTESFLLLCDDDGPGIPMKEREEVLARGMRLDERMAGHGLGLGIARDIVEAWSGTLRLLDSPMGGLRVEVCLSRRWGVVDGEPGNGKLSSPLKPR